MGCIGLCPIECAFASQDYSEKLLSKKDRLIEIQGTYSKFSKGSNDVKGPLYASVGSFDKLDYSSYLNTEDAASLISQAENLQGKNLDEILKSINNAM